MHDVLDQLNPEQLAAVTATEGNTLVLAGAGSGKTRVLTTRMAWLIQTGQVSPLGVLAVTFTNKAAREMLARLSSMLPIDTRSLWIGTFHGLCHRLLRIHHRDARLPAGFQIIDTQDQLAVLKRVLKAAGLDDTQCPPKPLQWFINHQKEQGLRAKDIIPADSAEQRLIDMMLKYEAQCEQEGLVDFAELLLRSVELLQREPGIARHYQQRFRHILIDEFQDTNKLQYRWMSALRGPETHLFAVGDDDQSIYAFRGADTANIARFEQEFARGNLIKLEQNYRSVGHVLHSANALIGHNQKRLGKNLWTDQGDGERLRIYESAADTQEAQWIVDEARALSGQGMAWGDMAILYRSNAQSRVLEHALFNAGVPYRVYGGLRFFERQEVKHALAYLRLIANPGDDHAFLRIVNVPPRGIGARSIEILQAAATTDSSALFAAASKPAVTAGIRGKSGQGLSDFCTLISHLEQQAQFLPLGDLISEMLKRSGLLAGYQSEKDATERVENLEELVNAAWAFCTEHGYAPDVAANGPPPEASTTIEDSSGEILSTWIAPLHAFLSHAALEAGDNQAQAGQSAVQMMTVHAAKGLEFNAVFVAGLEEGLFPHENSLLEPAGLEEERRLMYVAITRARERLYLTLSQTRMLHGQTRYNLRSRFLEELPEDSVQWLSPKAYRGDLGLMDSANQRWGGQGQVSASQNSWRRGGQAAAPRTLDNGRLSSPDGRWVVGQQVHHARFGDGVILQFEGLGEEARAQVNFKLNGTKWLALAIAKLEAA